MGEDDVFDDGESESGAAAVAGAVFMNAIKAVENKRLRAKRDAWSVVSDGDGEVGVISFCGDGKSEVARVAFGYQDPNFVRAPVFLPLAYTAQLTENELTDVLHQANCAADALSRVASLYSVRGLIAELAPAALPALAAPPEHDVVLHMSARGLEVDYASQPDAAFVVHRPDDPEKLAASIVRNAPPRYAARAKALA